MHTVHRTVILESEQNFGGRIPPKACGAVLQRLDLDLRSAISMGFRGASRAPGRPPRWLLAASDVRFVGIEGRGATVLHFEAPTFGAAAPELYEQAELWPTRPDPEFTGFEALCDVVREVALENLESDRFDPPLLRGIAGFGQTLGSLFRCARLQDVREGREQFTTIDQTTAETARRLGAEAPAEQRVKVVGRLDMLRVSTQAFALQLSSGEEVRGILTKGDVAELRSLLREQVLVEGRAVFRPSGRLLRIDAEAILAGAGLGEFFSRIPVPARRCRDARRLQRLQTSTSGANAIFGRWPGDETEEELLLALEELS